MLKLIQKYKWYIAGFFLLKKLSQQTQTILVGIQKITLWDCVTYLLFAWVATECTWRTQVLWNNRKPKMLKWKPSE